MITATGKNLNVLIICETGMNWQSFATWYSIFKNWPDASVKLYCHRTLEAPFEYFQWAKRLRIESIKSKPFTEENDNYLNWLGALKKSQEKNLINQPVLLIRPYVMAIDKLNKNFLEKLENNFLWLNEDAFFIKNQNIDKLIDDYCLEGNKKEISTDNLCIDVKSSEVLFPLVCYKKGCGRWIDTARGCPFSNAGGLITSESTANETRVIELWKKMVPLYHAVV